MPVLAVVLLIGVLVVAGLAGAAAFAAARRRFAARLDAVRGRLEAEIGARGQVAGLLQESEAARAQAEDEARRAEEARATELAEARLALAAARAHADAEARRGEEALRHERERLEAELSPLREQVARLGGDLGQAERRDAEAEAALRGLEAKLVALGASAEGAAAALAARTAELERLRDDARTDARRAAQREQQILAELEQARARNAEAAEARRLADEDARLARTAKEAFAGEVKLLREEVRRAAAQLAEASEQAANPPPAPISARPLTVVHTSSWYCQACGSMGTKPEKSCCAKAGIQPDPKKGGYR